MRCWTGIRASDALYTGDYFGAVATLYGMQDGALGVRIDHNCAKNDAKVGSVINDQVCQTKKRFDNLDVVAYNQPYVDMVRYHESEAFMVLDSKSRFREVASSLGVPALEVGILPSDVSDIYDYLSRNFGDGTYVIQSDISSGGDGTYVLNERNRDYIDFELRDRKGKWIYSRYCDGSVSVNVHLLISDTEVFLAPGSVQITRLCGYRILYRGADYPAYRSLDSGVRSVLEDSVRIMGREIQRLGYRGVAGIDAIVHGDKAELVEVNLRFQASTFLINRAMLDASKTDPRWDGVTVHSLNEIAQSHGKLSDVISEPDLAGLGVEYSFYTYIKEDSGDNELYEGFLNENRARALQRKHIFKRLNDSMGYSSDVLSVSHDEWTPGTPDGNSRIPAPRHVKQLILVTDGYVDGADSEPYAYMYKVVTNRRILTCTMDVTPELAEPEWFIEDFSDPIKLKIALVNQGIRIPRDVATHHAFAVNNSIDLRLSLDDGSSLWVNSPCSDYHATLSPFELMDAGDGFDIAYYGEPLGLHVGYDADQYPHGSFFDESLGYKENDLCVITTDRLRVQHSDRCRFQLQGRPCVFCEVSLDGSPLVDRELDPLSSFSIDDIVRVLSDRLSRNMPDENGRRLSFRHIMIGGKTCPNDSQARRNIKRICETIYEFSQGDHRYDIYLMSVPTDSEEVLREYRSEGITRIGFNMDVLSERNIRTYAPGKASFGREYYIRSLKSAVSVFGKGLVYSAFVAGLDPLEDCREWIDSLTDIGVVPIISAFRPVPKTKAAMDGPSIPTNGFLLALYEYAVMAGKGCGGFSDEGVWFEDLLPGPSCEACQNNTIALPWGLR